MRVREVVSLLSLLMKRRSQYYNELNKSSQKLSITEVEMLCLLLEVSIACCFLAEGTLHSGIWF